MPKMGITNQILKKSIILKAEIFTKTGNNART